MKQVKIGDLAFQQRANDELAVFWGYQDLSSNAKLQAVRVFPKAHIKPHKHPLRTEVVQILTGTGEILVNGEIVATSPGEFVLVQPGDIHEVINYGDDMLTLVIFRANDQGDEDIVWLEEADNE